MNLRITKAEAGVPYRYASFRANGITVNVSLDTDGNVTFRSYRSQSTISVNIHDRKVKLGGWVYAITQSALLGSSWGDDLLALVEQLKQFGKSSIA